MDQELVQLSKAISHALRHAPWVYELELDKDGWVNIDDLLDGLADQRRQWEQVSENDLQRIIDQSDKQRFEISEGLIRALYGHSVPNKLLKTPAVPPDTLFHGTPDRTVQTIRTEGLKPMSRQYVHLSIDQATAMEVARRKGGKSVILRISATQAHQNGVQFYQGNDKVWLADLVPPEYIIVPR